MGLIAIQKVGPTLAAGMAETRSGSTVKREQAFVLKSIQATPIITSSPIEFDVLPVVPATDKFGPLIG